MDPQLAAGNTSQHLQELPLDESLAFVFPVQGSQKVGMGNDVRAASAVAREVFAIADDAVGFALASLCADGPDDELTRTENAQPAILTASLAVLAAALESGAITARPAFVAGHSLGEYTALVAAGSLDITDAVRLVRERGRLMGASTDGTMAAVIGVDEATVAAICSESGAEVANYNGPTQTVVGGSHEAVERACALARERGGRGLPVNVSGAFHTSLMEPAAREFAKTLDAAAIDMPQITVIANVSAQPITTVDRVRAELSRQIGAPVRWYQSMNWLEANGVRRVMEIGGKTLTAQLKRSNPNLECIAVDEAAALGRAARTGEASNV
ncbi:MAG: ACP S-malonyltransferase [Chloroflexota bacterium]